MQLALRCDGAHTHGNLGDGKSQVGAHQTFHQPFPADAALRACVSRSSLRSLSHTHTVRSIPLSRAGRPNSPSHESAALP